MPENIRALIVVLALAVPAFYVGRQLSLSVLAPREFAVWRNAWFVATSAAFLCSNFFIFAAIVVILCVYVYSARAASAAIFVVLLLAVPLIGVPIGGLGFINMLFAIDNARLLAIVLLLPLAFTGRIISRNANFYAMPDRLIISYVLFLIALEFQTAEVTQIMRSATLLTLDVLIPYFAFSRAVTNVADLRRVFLAFSVAVLPLSLIAVFETAKGWLLYSSISQSWGDPLMTGYLRREGMLRATASTFSPIVLGFVIMVAVGCVLALRQTIGSRKFAGIALAILAFGLVASLSRGPWIGISVLVLVFVITGVSATANLGKLAAIAGVAFLFLSLTSVGGRLLEFLPFIGSVDAGGVSYRQRLFDNAVLVIERNLWFGSADYLAAPEMREMIQGEGIIDIVNTYLQIALRSGLVGLVLFSSFFLAILIGLLQLIKFRAAYDAGFSVYARASMATLCAILVTVATVSSIDFIPYVYWSFAGLCVALIRIGYRERQSTKSRPMYQVPA